MPREHLLQPRATLALPPSLRGHSWLRRVLGLVLLWSARSRQRRRLGALDEIALLDIGLTKADVRGETSKSFWQA
jgi:uncharacterized protein YjiS (DUF1127 family)